MVWAGPPDEPSCGLQAGGDKEKLRKTLLVHDLENGD